MPCLAHSATWRCSSDCQVPSPVHHSQWHTRASSLKCSARDARGRESVSHHYATAKPLFEGDVGGADAPSVAYLAGLMSPRLSHDPMESRSSLPRHGHSYCKTSEARHHPRRFSTNLVDRAPCYCLGQLPPLHFNHQQTSCCGYRFRRS